MNESIDLLNELAFSFTPRKALAVALLHLSIEHRNAILVSVKHGLTGSAHALLRPQLESAVRGFWVVDHASDSDIAKFAGGAEPPRIDKLLTDLKSSERFDGSLLASVKDKNWKAMCDLTHGGARQAGARVQANEVSAGFTAGDLIELLDFSASGSAFVAAGMADIAENSVLVGRIAQAFYAIYRAEA